MSGNVKIFNRRMFLGGTGGFLLALPFLPSLASAAMRRQVRPQRFIAFATNHGGVWERNMFPARSTLTETASHAGYTIRRGALNFAESSGRAQASPVLSASAEVLTAQLRGKINVINGLDYACNIGHHWGGHLGNFAANPADGGDGVGVQSDPRPTIDQILAWSPSFYPDMSTIRERMIQIGPRLSWGWSSPSTQSGEIQPVSFTISSQEIFDLVYVRPQNDGEDPKVPVVDRVLDNYRRLRTGNKRLSAGDRRRLDEHIQRIYELQRKLKVQVSCGDVQRPERDSWRDVISSDRFMLTPEMHLEAVHLFNEVMAIAMLCDTCRIFVVGPTLDNLFVSFGGDWHQDIAHQAELIDGAAQAQNVATHQGMFEHVFCDMARRLDVPDGEDGTLLDHSLLMWTQECGNWTHYSQSIPVVTAGSAGGYFRTGQYVDYRNMGRAIIEPGISHEDIYRYPGLLWNQWLATVLQSMGLSPAEFERNPGEGYGVVYVGEEARKHNLYSTSVLSNLSAPLPFLRP